MRLEKSNEMVNVLQERIEKLSKVNEQLEKEKELLERKLTQPALTDQNTSSLQVRNTYNKKQGLFCFLGNAYNPFNYYYRM